MGDQPAIASGISRVKAQDHQISRCARRSHLGQSFRANKRRIAVKDQKIAFKILQLLAGLKYCMGSAQLFALHNGFCLGAVLLGAGLDLICAMAGDNHGVLGL